MYNSRSADVSMVDLTVNTDRPSSLEEVMEIFRKAADGSMAGVLQVSDQDLVSSDLLGTSFSAVVDSKASLELNQQVRTGHFPELCKTLTHWTSFSKSSRGTTTSGDILADCWIWCL